MVDETGDLKKGRHTAGVRRQYTGTAGRIENAQVAVYLTYASRHGHAGIDRSLYLPRSWSDAPERCRRAAVPEEIGFATKPQLAQQMIERAPQYKEDGWHVYQARTDKPVTGKEPCVRSHINADDNGNAGLALGRQVQRMRVLGMEKYDVLSAR
ncbi:hypothetical protein SGPA1_41077 [Streptomyces misionensis JCM 4497]